MIIGVDGSRAFIRKRTGIEEYSYQTIKHLRNKLGESTQACPPKRRVVLYLRANQEVDFDLPENWKIKKLWAPRFWTQIRLSLEMIAHPVDVLFIPAHTVPIIHPKKSIVTVHGLEYEILPQAYSLWERIYMRWSIKNSCRWASQIVSVSENTKKDLIRLYGVSKEKIKVIYEGYENQQLMINEQRTGENKKSKKNSTSYKLLTTNYLLFVGRLEERKNIIGIIKAFEILKEKYGLSHRLVLAGKPGHKYEDIKYVMNKYGDNGDIEELGYISEEEKWKLLKNADVFLFPTLYEGFGIPILEAQSVGTPVVAGNNSSVPEVTGGSALLVDVNDPEKIAEAVQKLVSNETLKNDIIEKGNNNVKRFSLDKCAEEIAEILTK